MKPGSTEGIEKGTVTSHETGAKALALSSPAYLAGRPIRHALVLGGTGFIGTPLMRSLGDAGVRTTCLVHRMPLQSQISAVQVVRGSLDRYPWHTLERDAPDVVFHLARIPGRGGLRGALTRVRNRLANERLVLALAALPRPPLVVFIGGTLAYGSHTDELITESTPLAPTSFSRDYHAAELPWLTAQRTNDVPVMIARPAWVLGRGSWFAAFYQRVIQAERYVPQYGDGENWMSLVHVEDCASFLLYYAQSGLPGSAVNVFAGPPIRQRELSERLARLTGLPVRRISLEEMERRFDRAVRQAFEFSARIGTVHSALHAGFRGRHRDLDRDLEDLLLAEPVQG
ncbi:MAG TPA: NAD(P)-dependent oxidoreductase [Gemmatimonadales bacterium]|nr:NAD(P)-dependent oxidoreductase [Gemmatimonadales bacterium]